MKELTIEEKAARYDEAIKRAKSKIKNDKDHVLYEDDIIEILPELKESEDEKIRKWLISTLKSLNSTAVQIDGAYEMMLPAIAWLEKQGKKGANGNNEEIPNSAWSEEDEKMLNSFLHKLEVCQLLSNKENVWAIRKFKALKDRCTWIPSEEQIKAVRLARSFVTDDFSDNPTLSEILTELEEQLKKLREE